MYGDYARELFCWHAFGHPHPARDYENLVNSFLNVCGGLPLSLQVLGRDQNYWSLELKKFRKTLPRDIRQRLGISIDALDDEEQQIFMDLACFFVDKSKSIAMQVWEASGWSAQHALETLKNKCLVQEIEKMAGVGEDTSALRMHDHLRDLGREMADRLSPRRLWRPRDLECLVWLFLFPLSASYQSDNFTSLNFLIQVCDAFVIAGIKWIPKHPPSNQRQMFPFIY